jgi:hypothetical protein
VKFLGKLRHFRRPKFVTFEIWTYTSCETLGSNFKNLRKTPLGKPTRILKTLTTCQIIITRRFFYTAQFFNFLGFFYYFSDLSILLSCVTCGYFFNFEGHFGDLWWRFGMWWNFWSIWDIFDVQNLIPSKFELTPPVRPWGRISKIWEKGP